MPSIWSDTFHSIRIPRFSSMLYRKGISLRHLTFAIVFSTSLWILYYTLYSSDLVNFFPQEVKPDNFILPEVSQEVWAERATQVKEAFLHAYHGYERYASGWDELKPLSNGKINNFNGWGVTAIDSLDTMLLMGLDEEFKRALPLVHAANFSLPDNNNVPFFETVIRYLGGLLSAYTLSEEEILLTRADDLGRLLSPAFMRGSSGFPVFGVDTVKAQGHGPTVAVLAEIASFQMEYTFLGKLTGKKEHVQRATNVTHILAHANLNASGGFYPTRWNLGTGKPSDKHMSMGAAADSGHEYTLKQYLLTGQTDKENLKMYLRATSYAISHLIYISPIRQFLYVTDTQSGRPSHNFEHLSCFFPGLLALGAHMLPLDDLGSLGIDFMDLAADLPSKEREAYAILASYNLKELHMWAAEGLAQSCWLMYADQPTGLGADVVNIRAGSKKGVFPWMESMEKWRKWGRHGSPPGLANIAPWQTDKALSTSENLAARDYNTRVVNYLLRPETLESLFILWKVTGNERWRHHAWSIFAAIEKETKTKSGYASLSDVRKSPATKQDSMPSYFLAETLKYLYLTFIDEDLLPLDKWVFNTEAHPFPVFSWTEKERGEFGIPQ